MGTVSEDIKNEEAAKLEMIDYKMVTFSLAGKDYGIDIMKVKEISKAARFTYVPNALPYVRGVYNLRGDIISVIDLRIMFNLQAEKKNNDKLENMIILRLDDYLIGVIVDSIDKVVGISSKTIQPPHPIFGDINIKFIKGVVENDNRLYLILDVESIFGQEGLDEKEAKTVLQTVAGVGEVDSDSSEDAQTEVTQTAAEGQDLTFTFITDSLRTMKSFYTTDVNISWAEERFKEWQQLRSSKGYDLQLTSKEDAENFIESFYSPCTGSFWTPEYQEQIKPILKSLRPSGRVTVWNPGCGKGFETYSLAVLLKEEFSGKALKIWASDNDLLSISTAPNLLFQEHEVSDNAKLYTVEGNSGLSFNQEIKDCILFEFHDVLHPSSFPEVDLIIARDLLSFFNPENQKLLMKEFLDKLKKSGIVIVGTNEELIGPEWEALQNKDIIAFRKL